MLEEYFQKLGFNDSEARVYLALAEVGKSTAQALAKRLDIPRTTAYSVLESLTKKGVIAIERKKATTFFTANTPNAILRYLEREKEQLIAKESVAKELVKLAAPFFKSKHFSVPKLMFFEGRANVESLLYDYTARWRESMAKYDFTWWGFQDHHFVEHYRSWLEWHWKTNDEKEQIKLVSNAAIVEKELKGKVTNREIRNVGDDFGFSSSLWVCGDYIILIMCGDELHYAFQLNDPVFGLNLRSVFKLLWGSLD